MAPPPYLAFRRETNVQPLAQTLSAAMARYREKWRTEPTLCLVNPSDEAELASVQTIEVRPLSIVSPGVLYVGVEGS